jgi:hypothetical protein
VNVSQDLVVTLIVSVRNQPLPAGDWIESGTGSLAILTYEQVRTAPDPRRTLLASLQAAYEGRRPTSRMGHRQLRIEMVPDPNPAARPSGHRGTRLRPTRLRGLTRRNEGSRRRAGQRGIATDTQTFEQSSNPSKGQN